jgi:Flp pilus assembly pilin Flp
MEMDMSLLKRLKTEIQAFISNARAATAIEYGLIVALISIAMTAAVFLTGDNIKNVLYGSIATALKGM